MPTDFSLFHKFLSAFAFFLSYPKLDRLSATTLLQSCIDRFLFSKSLIPSCFVCQLVCFHSFFHKRLHHMRSILNACGFACARGCLTGRLVACLLGRRLIIDVGRKTIVSLGQKNRHVCLYKLKMIFIRPLDVGWNDDPSLKLASPSSSSPLPTSGNHPFKTQSSYSPILLRFF